MDVSFDGTVAPGRRYSGKNVTFLFYRRIRPTQTKYFQSGARSLSTNRKNEPAVIVSAAIPEYVSMRHRK